MTSILILCNKATGEKTINNSTTRRESRSAQHFGRYTYTDIPSTIHVNFGLNVIHQNYGKDEVQLPDQVISLYAS